VFDKVVATNKATVLGNDLQDEFDVGWQCDVLAASLVYEVTQNLISRFSDHHELLAIT
jgi:hypothetical protein